MSKKPNQQIRIQFYRNRHGEYDRTQHKYLYEGTYRWSVKIEVIEHSLGYSFLDQNNHTLSFASLRECKAYADEVVKEIKDSLEGK